MTQIIPGQQRMQMAQVSLSEAHGEQPPDLERGMWELLSATTSAHPDREAIVSLWQHAITGPPESSACLRWTYRDLQERAEDVACVLEAHGCGPGMPLAVILWNCAEWGLLFWAAARLGMTFVPMDPRETDDILAFMLDAVRPKVLVVQDGETATALSSRNLTSLNSCHARFHCSDQDVDGWISLSRFRSSDSGPDRRPQIKLNPRVTSNQEPSRAPALIVFTSGTTGRPKGCLHTNRGLVSQTNAYDVSPDAAQPDRWLVHTPVSHVFAINNALRAWRLGDVVVFPARCFSVDSTATALVQERCTIMSATPTLVRALLSHSKMPIPPAAASSLSLISIAGTMIGPPDIRLCREEGLGARDAIQAYGMSEGAPLISWSRQDDMLVDGYHPGVGKALPGTWLRICPPDSIMPVPRTMIGELHVGGPSVISGYLGDVESDKFYDDGAGRWLRTGDQAMMTQEGVVHILGRYKDLIIRGGENINPLMIESVLNKLPGVEAQVIGAPDGIAGQVPVAVVKVLPKGIPKAQLMNRARLLGRRYVLGGVYTLQELGLENMPLTSLGKPKKAILANLVAKRRLTGKVVERGRKMERRAQCQLARLEETLLAAWKQVTGIRPGKSDDVLYLADSITLLRFCDAVLRSCGRQIYLEDLHRGGETVKKLARLLTSRGGDFKPRGCLVDDGDDDKHHGKSPWVGKGHLEPSKPSLDGKSNGNVWASSQAQFRRLGLGHGVVEDFIPIRHSMHRMVLGERPQSYHVRIVFRVRDATPERVYRGLSKALASRPIMRTMMFCSSQGQPYHAVVGHSEELLDRLIQRTDVESQDEAEKLCEDASMASHPREFMFKATIITVVEPSREQQVLLVMTYNHSIVDALTLLSWHRDVDGLIRDGDDATLSKRTPYRLFADMLSQYEASEPAMRSVSFHARRFRGISRYHTKALWPIQRAPGMLISHDDDDQQAAQRQAARMSVWQGTWEARAPSFRFPRRSRVVRLAGLPRLREAHGVEPVVLAMSAVAIFNVGQTQSPVALFSSWESGRSWPFVPGWMESRLPPATSIDGPTAQWMLNMTEVRGDETLADFLRRTMGEREQACLHVHAPWDKVVQELREEGRVAVEASFRQSFVWDVSMGLAASRSTLGDLMSLEPVSRYDWPDCGFFWNAFMVDSTNLFFVASWDTAQMNAEEVDGCCDALASVMRKLANQANWERTMSEVFAEVRN